VLTYRCLLNRTLIWVLLKPQRGVGGFKTRQLGGGGGGGQTERSQGGKRETAVRVTGPKGFCGGGGQKKKQKGKECASESVNQGGALQGGGGNKGKEIALGVGGKERRPFVEKSPLTKSEGGLWKIRGTNVG